MRSVILGGSAGVGRALSESLAARGDDLLLIATDPEDLDAQAAHLRTVYGCDVRTLVTDATALQRSVEDVCAAIHDFGPVDRLLFPIGVSRSDDRGALNALQSMHLINANLTVVIGVVASVLPAMLARGRGNIIGFGSVASVRGRSTNVVYSAAKRALESYFQSLCHMTSATQLRVHFYRLGYVASQQSFGQRLIFPATSTKSVSEAVVDRLGKPSGFYDFPWFWRPVGRIVKALPWMVFKRLKF